VVCSKIVNFCWRFVNKTQRKRVMSPKMKKMSATTGMRYEIEFCKSMTSLSSASECRAVKFAFFAVCADEHENPPSVLVQMPVLNQYLNGLYSSRDLPK